MKFRVFLLVDISIIAAYRRFAGGVYALWYPLKHYQEIRCFLDALYKTQIPKILRLELAIRTPSEGPSLDGSGMIIINPPYLLRKEINSLAPLLLSRLSQDPEAKLTNEWIRYES
ncbi:23S rRNA (adenine(2030)-N(6))-methyltransferase RlmJ [Bartonella sp. DGB2]|uniref:23S rRNA (adenine(2030)-N(6))-methyltransferase RlmJ n=1 Tax=Bartonella sp. DGB2 TaxID=3388426 RepID=UPI00398FECF2